MVTTKKPRLVIEYCNEDKETIVKFKQECIAEHISFTRKVIQLIKNFLLTKQNKSV